MKKQNKLSKYLRVRQAFNWKYYSSEIGISLVRQTFLLIVYNTMFFLRKNVLILTWKNGLRVKITAKGLN